MEDNAATPTQNSKLPAMDSAAATNRPEVETPYNVVMNHEEQYSVWPVDREIPLGWQTVGRSGTKEDCLKHIEEIWTDMRPLSLRKAMEESRTAGTGKVTEAEAEEYESPVVRLAKGSHPVRAVVGKDGGFDAFKQAVKMGYVHVEFTDTQGGTNLGLRLDREECDLQDCDSETPAGRVRLVGRLTFDYVKVRCTAEIDLATLVGSGRLDVESSSQ
jgi:uncharacterized protein YbdZ (MbtH family)